MSLKPSAFVLLSVSQQLICHICSGGWWQTAHYQVDNCQAHVAARVRSHTSQCSAYPKHVTSHIFHINTARIVRSSYIVQPSCAGLRGNSDPDLSMTWRHTSLHSPVLWRHARSHSHCPGRRVCSANQQVSCASNPYDCVLNSAWVGCCNNR